MNLFAATLFSFLPRRYRHALLQGCEIPATGAFLGGILEMLTALGLFIHRYFLFANNWLGSVPATVVNGGMMHSGETSVMTLGVFVIVGYVFQPLSIILVYFTLEGAVRAAAAGLSGEITPSLPFQLVALLQTKAEAWREEANLGPRLVDQVERADPEGGDLRIASCRPKPDWDNLVTISYGEMLYEVAGHETGSKPRPFVYLLRQKPEYKLIRGLRHYDPEDVLGGKK